MIVVGGGIAGVSAAYELAAHADVVLLEREEQLAHHTTGRSAAAYLETYGSPTVRRLTIASRGFFSEPPAELESPELLSPRPLLWIGPESRRPVLETLATAGQALVPSVRLIDADEARALCPVLRPEFAAVAMLEPDAMDIDVAALHQAYVRGLRQRGGDDHPVRPCHRRCVVTATVGSSPRRRRRCGPTSWSTPPVHGPTRWRRWPACDRSACNRLRRTAFTCPAPEGIDVRAWPLVADVDDRFYFKPEGPQLLCSLADETPSPPCDAQPDEVDVALAIERINEATTLDLRHVRRAWAGLRSFVADRTPVVGMDPEVAGFCWLAGQGGYGIQTAPGMARATAGLVLEGRLPEDLRAMGVTEADLSPQRCR